MSQLLLQPLLESTWQTIYMVFISGFISIFLGLVLGAVLFVSRQGQLLQNKACNSIVGVIVNIVRSVPFIILMIAIIPLTRVIVGTSIGTNAAIVPLAIAAIPFFARIAEAAMSEVDGGLIEAAQAMGATPLQIVRKVLIPEALPGLIRGGTLTIIGLIGYSAMAGAVGGGGLGQLAIEYGYQQFNLWVMIETVVVLVVLVQIIQSLGDYFAARRSLKVVAYLSVVLWVACIGSIVWALQPQVKELKVGISAGPMQKVLAVAQKVAEQHYNLKLDIIPFDDYVLPNTALNSGNLDANIFQHVPYLDSQIKARGFKLVPIARTFVYPMGVFSRKIHSLKQLKYGAVVAIPNDPSNQGRALRLFAKQGLITLKPGVGITGTVLDIRKNPDHLKFKPIDAAQLPRVFKDATLVALTNDYVAAAHFTLAQALFHEGPNAPYANVIVVQTKNKNLPVYKKLIAVMHSKAVLDETYKLFPHGAAIAAWKGAPKK